MKFYLFEKLKNLKEQQYHRLTFTSIAPKYLTQNQIKESENVQLFVENKGSRLLKNRKINNDLRSAVIKITTHFFFQFHPLFRDVCLCIYYIQP